ncbi:MAG TPA: HTTM domain-containing protein [Verrucomicrobiae bacterium]|nr:HTTM domain-containing protein [Verrucomicrobiae bacterium]
MGPINRLTGWAQKEGQVLGLALFRILVGLMALRYLAGFARDYTGYGFYGDYFFFPYSTAIPQPSEVQYIALLIAGGISAAALIIGFHTRIAAVTTLLVVTYHFSLNEIWHRHNRYFLVLSLLLVCLAPSGRALSFDARRRRRPRIGPLWTGFLIKAQMTLIYLASAVSKTMDAAWRNGDVLEGRGLEMAWARWMPGFVLDWIPPDAAVRLITMQALASEFLLGILLWFKGTRRLAIWWGILFHGYIEVQYSVLTFTYLTLATYFVFADLKCGKKSWVYSSQSAASVCAAKIIGWLDWLFQIRLEAYSGRKQRFVDMDGTPYGGMMGWIMLGANLPIFYPICYPLSWLRFTRWGRCRFSIISAPAEPGRSLRPSRIVQWMILYLAFLTPISITGQLQSPTDAMRFWDLPWFFALMCLVAGTYRHGLMQAAPVGEPATACEVTATLEPSPATN